MIHGRSWVPHIPIRDLRPRRPSRDLTVTLTERERRIIARSLEFMEDYAAGLGWPHTNPERAELRRRMMDGLEP